MRRILFRYLFSFLIILVSTGRLFSDTEVSSEVDLKKRADHYFAAENYEKALPDYSRLLSLYPKESIYNYRFGVCLLLSGKEKSNAATYLENSSKDPKVPEEVWYYLGKSYMINNEFSKASEAFEKFKTTANSVKQKKFEIDACIKNCESGISLSKTRKNVVIISSVDVAKNTFFNNFDFTPGSGKVVNAADQFLTDIDREKQKNPVMYISNDKQKVFVSSYGKNGITGKDIYIIRKTSDSQWSQPESIGATINSEADEDFPFLDRDGRTLYFSSKGYNSIGGYDIFRSVFNFTSGMWSPPENMGIPINTPGDDLLFVPDDMGTNVTYATTVESPNNSIAIRKIKMPSSLHQMLTISGTYIPEDQKMRRDARISILTSTGDGIVTSVHTDPTTGKYELVLQPGQNYMIVVEGGGYLPHAEMFDLPSGMVNPDLKQVVKINKKDQTEELTLQNYFSSAGSSQPSKSITRSYSTKIDSSSMMSVKINDQIIYVTAPVVTNEEKTDVSVANNDNVQKDYHEEIADSIEALLLDTASLSNKNLNRKDKYDPTLVSGFSDDELKQKDEEKERMKEVKEDETKPEKSLDINVSNEELANMAYNDAKAIQQEADSVKKEVESLRVMSTEKQELSIIQKNQAEVKGIPSDSSAALMTQSETNRIEAEELSKQADALVIIANSKQEEAKTAIDEANTIFKNGKSSESIAAENKKTSVNKNTKNNSDQVKDNSKNSTADQYVLDSTKPVSDANSQKSEVTTPKQTNPAPINLYEEPLISDDGVNSAHASSSCVDDVVPKEYGQSAVAANESSANKNEAIKPTTPNNEPVTYNTIKKDNATPIGRFLSTEIDTSSNPSQGNSVAENVKPEKTESLEINNKINAPANTATDNKAGTDLGNSKDVIINNTDKAATTNVADTNPAESNKIKNTVDSSATQPVAANISGNVNTINKPTESLAPSSDTKMSSEKIDSAVADINSKMAEAGKPLTTTSSDSSIQKNNLIANNVPVTPKSENTPSTLSMPGAKQNTFGSQHTDSVFAVSDAMIKKNAPMPVKEEAKVAYREYQSLMKHSNELTTKSIGLQNEISRLHPSDERDSLIRESNQAALESVHEWQEALKKIQEARKIDPGVEYKMSVNDYASNIKRDDSNVFGNEKASIENSSNSTLEADALTTKTPTGLTETENKFNYTDGSTDSSIKYFQDKGETDSNLDTLHPEYPTYVKLKKEINDKQVETIDVFAEAINLNKKSIEEKEREIALMDSAQAETDKDKKSALIKLSFEQKALSEKHASEAKEKFAIAQKHTQEVKGLKSDLASVRDRITLKPDPNSLTASTTLNSNNIKPISKSKTPDKASPVKQSAAKNQPSKNTADTVKSKPVFAKSNADAIDVMAGEEEIESVNVTTNNLDEFKKLVFGKNDSPYYSDKNPIPMDPTLPEGLIFKVQIGAFHKPLPSDIFKGLQPISGETTRPGWIRYCAGLFKAFEPANIVKKEIQKIGYKDAFVVAYYNGKRIELNDAYAMLRAKENLVAYKSESAKEIAMLRALNISSSTMPSAGEDKDVSDFYGKTSPSTSIENSKNGKKEYAVQLGVFRTPKAPAYIASVKPLQTVPSQSNMYRFTTGRFSNYSKADAVKKQIVRSGIKDAFVVVYKNGVVINSDEEMTPEKETANSVKENAGLSGEKEPDLSFLSHQLVFTVQIGAYKNNIPYNSIESYLQIIDKGVFEKTNERGLHVFYVGNFKTFNDASVLEAEIKSKGLKDAFIVALRDGKRIPISDEMKK